MASYIRTHKKIKESKRLPTEKKNISRVCVATAARFSPIENQAGISDGAIGGAHALTMLGNAEQNGLFWGFFGRFEPLLSEISTTS